MRPGYKRNLIALLLFGVAFGYVEAAVVSYLRPLFEPVRHRYYPLRSPDDLFPLLTFDQVGSAGHEYFRLVEIEHGREVATLGMLAAVAIAVGQEQRSVVRGLSDRVRRLGHLFLRLSEAVDPLARLATHLGRTVPAACTMGRAGAGSSAGVPVHDRSRAPIPGTRLAGRTRALKLAEPARNLGWSRDRHCLIHSGFS